MSIENISAYQVIEKREIRELASVGYLLKHKKTGANVLVMSNDDNNKVFSIAFRTPPADSTGVPHILEHSVLCGSRHFPAKDPFIELAKGSLNTFLNAMTYPDKTIYPVASCNEKDFKNLMHVYMDAVLYPNIYEREEIFRQEGWHYELESEDAPLSYNGVVYNEMKGAFSSPEQVLERVILNKLYPDTAYANESGGDPENIPDLSYEQFKAFHSRYYHPSNSYIYLYGDCDMGERLTWLDKEYLSRFDKIEVDSAVKFQPPFDGMREAHCRYSITEDESEQDNTYLSYNMVVDTSLNKELYLAFQILEYALLAAPGAPLKQALLDKKIGKDIISTYENGVYQPYVSVIAKCANPSDREAFLDTIRQALTQLSEQGIDKKALEAGINYFEFKYREADFGSYPKGLMYGLQAFDSWLYDEGQPFMHIEADETFRYIKEQVHTGYFEELIKKYLLDNPHSLLVIVEPQKGLTAKLEEETAKKLAAYKESLSKEALAQLVIDTQALRRYQEEPSSKEDLEKIPQLERADIRREAEPLCNEEKWVGDTLLLYHEVFTKGIGYLELLFDMSRVPTELLPYAGILKSVLGYVDTENYAYSELYNEINRSTGGITPGLSTFARLDRPDTFAAKFEIRAKVLYDKLGFAFDMIREILLTSRMDDDKRLYEIIAMLKSRMQMNLPEAGHSTAVSRALSYCSRSSCFSEKVGGIEFYRVIEMLEADFEGHKEELKSNLKALMHIIFRPENLMVDYTAEQAGLEGLTSHVEALKAQLYHDPIKAAPFELKPVQKNEGFKTASKVQYVALAGNFQQAGLSYTGALKVLKVILGYDYLWNNVRVKGGAYGCMNAFSRTGDSYLVSYRDPNLEKTLSVYEGVPDYIRSFTADERTMTKYIIGTVSDMDVPLTPSMKGSRSLSAYMNRISYERLQEERDQVLYVTEEDIQALAGHVEAILKQHNLCVVGSEEKLKADAALFGQVESLFS